MTELVKFLIVIFIVSFICDIILNILAHTKYVYSKLSIIKSLQSYFDKYNFIVSGINAGLTVVVATIITILISKITFNFVIPRTYNTLIKFLSIAFIVGYLVDFVIYKCSIFGTSLDEYYVKTGTRAGILGGFSFLIAIIITYIFL